MLQDLQQLAAKLTEQYNRTFNDGDRTLPARFKQIVTNIDGAQIEYNETSFIVQSTSSNKIYFPNQLWYVAAYFADYYSAISEYARYIKEMLKLDDNTIKECKGDPAKASSVLSQSFISSEDKALLVRFLSDYNWWRGGKTIDRQDYFYSPLISLAGLVNASQGFVAEMCKYLASHKDALSLLKSENELSRPKQAQRKSFAELTAAERKELFRAYLSRPESTVSNSQNSYLAGVANIHVSDFCKNMFGVDNAYELDNVGDIETLQKTVNNNKDSYTGGKDNSSHLVKYIECVKAYIGDEAANATILGPVRGGYLNEGKRGFMWDVLKYFNSVDGLKEMADGGLYRNPENKYAYIGPTPVAHIETTTEGVTVDTMVIFDGTILSKASEVAEFYNGIEAFNKFYAGRYVIEVTQNEQGDEVYYLHKIGDDATISPAFRPYVTAIKSKPFLLLAGISGTGKSRIVRQLARACWNANSEEYKAHKPSNFEMVQVKPNWHDSSELIGYVSRVSGQPVYVAGPFLKFVAKAWENPTVPYFLCLDEMNLAPVEQYFAEYLSVVESRKAENGVVMTDPILPAAFTKKEGNLVNEGWYVNLVDELLADCPNDTIYGLRAQFLDNGISIPQNLIVVGTVNMDETTFSFSRKVLDRAMTIEMNEVDLYGGLRERNDAIGHLSFNAIIGSAVEGVDVYSKHTAVCDKVLAYLKEVNDKLEQTPFKVAYRTRNEFLLYVVNNLTYGNTPKDIATAVDEITSMKILSRIEGDETKVDKLFKDEALLKTIKAQLQVLCADYNVEESVSVKKLIEMKKRLDSGYTSFWS